MSTKLGDVVSMCWYWNIFCVTHMVIGLGEWFAAWA